MNDLPHTPDRLSHFGHYYTRYALAAILLWIGALKFTAYEAKNIEGLLANSPLFAWALNAFGLRMLSNLIGVAEIVIGLLLASRKFSPKASALGALGAIGMFLSTLTFLVTTPGVWEPGYGFPFPSGMPGQFIAKDLVLLGVAIWLGAESLRAARAHTAVRESL